MKLIDLHQDLYLHSKFPNLFKNVQTSPELLKNSGVKLVIASAFAGNDCESEFGISETDIWQQSLDYYLGLCEQEGFFLVTSVDDLNNDNDKTGIIFHFEGVYCRFGSIIKILDNWFDKGLRSLGIAWIHDGVLSAGNLNQHDGLTDQGREVLEWANSKNIIIDLAHTSEKSFFEAIEILDKPIMVSHANVRSLCSNGVNRNLSDEQLIAVAKSGGVVGVMFAGNYVIANNQSTINDVVAHIYYIKELVGIDCVAIGSDFGGITGNTPKHLATVGIMNNLVNALGKSGFSADEIQKIFYRNADRVIRELL